MTTEITEPERYVFLVEGYLVAGTLADYARGFEQAHYAGLELSTTVKTWDATYRVQVRHTGTDEDDWMHYELSVGSETAHVTIDGRA